MGSSKRPLSKPSRRKHKRSIVQQLRWKNNCKFREELQVKKVLVAKNCETLLDQPANIPVELAGKDLFGETSKSGPSDHINVQVDEPWGSQAEYDEFMDHDLCIEPEEEKQVISGSRVVDINYVLKWATDLQYNHAKKCTTGRMQLVK